MVADIGWVVPDCIVLIQPFISSLSGCWLNCFTYAISKALYSSNTTSWSLSLCIVLSVKSDNTSA